MASVIMNSISDLNFKAWITSKLIFKISGLKMYVSMVFGLY